MEVLFKALAGSHLHGTATEKSDLDWRGVLIPSLYDVLFGHKETIVEQEDQDTVFWSLPHFIKLSAKGNPNILELWFSPQEVFQTTHPVWEHWRETYKYNLLSLDSFYAHYNWAKQTLQNDASSYKQQAHAIRLVFLCQWMVFRNYTVLLPETELAVVRHTKQYGLHRETRLFALNEVTRYERLAKHSLPKVADVDRLKKEVAHFLKGFNNE